VAKCDETDDGGYNDDNCEEGDDNDNDD